MAQRCAEPSSFGADEMGLFPTDLAIRGGLLADKGVVVGNLFSPSLSFSFLSNQQVVGALCPSAITP